MVPILTKSLPNLPGVYLFKNAQGEVVYIGKAKNLKKRVRSYFKMHHNWKLNVLMAEYADLDFIITHTETEAMLLEAQLIQAHQPKFNSLLKDGQPFIYLLFTKEALSKLVIARNKKQKGTYFGPFLQKSQARKVHRFLTETFNLNFCNKKIPNGCLDYHLGRCAGNCRQDFDAQEYLLRLDLAQDALKSHHAQFLKRLKDQIAIYNKNFDFEKSKRLHAYIQNLQPIFSTIKLHYTPAKYEDQILAALMPKVKVVSDPIELARALKERLFAENLVRTIDCFDVSHFQGRFLVGSCVRFTDGVPDKNKLRRFKIRTLTRQDDYASLREIVSRRYKNGDYPDVVLIDGGKGQLNAVKDLIPKPTLCVSLAKKEEELYGLDEQSPICLDPKNDADKTLLAIRDYAHHFAIKYHRLRRSKEN